jgi:hypothetical protein
VWDHVHTALSPQGDELSPRGSWGICVPVLPEGLTAQVSNKVTKTTQCEHSTQNDINSEGGHTNDGPGSISEGAGANTKSFPHKFVTRQFLEHGNCQLGNFIGQQSLEKTIFSTRISTLSNMQIKGVHGTHEIPRPPTSVEKRI